MTDIRDNVAVGRTVTMHEKTIHYKDWKGSGYIIIDPNTGTGAYLIDGGANGGYIILIGLMYLFLGLIGLMVSLSGIILAIATGGASLLATIAAITTSIVVIMKGLAILNPKFALNQCKNYATNILIGSFGTLVGAMTSSTIIAVIANYMGVSMEWTSWLTKRICGV